MTSNDDVVYAPNGVEQVAQDFWEEQGDFQTDEDLSREKYYCLSMLPYPSGDLHMGHVRNYVIGDMLSRYHAFHKKNVLQPMGWDAFGLPAENAALKRQLPPAEWTEKNIKKMRKQLKQLGLAVDWSREINTSDPSYYRWEQWLFVRLFEKGLVYQKKAAVNWDPVDQTVLANEQVINGRGWRSDAVVEKRYISQWFLKITDYAQELLDGLDTLTGWPEQVRTMQRHWIGQSEGLTITFKVKGRQHPPIDVFTTRPDTLMGVACIALSAEHPLAFSLAEEDKKLQKFIDACQKTQVNEETQATQEKTGYDTGLFANHPITKKPVPIWVTNFVLMNYGTGAIMAVPAHDARDHAFATTYNLPIPPVIAPADADWSYTEAAYTEPGVLINSGDYDGLSSEKGAQKIAADLIKEGKAEKVTCYRLRDWGISRQRYWGTPIPIIHCKKCGAVPVPEDQLPVELPTDLIPDGTGSPLSKCRSFYQTKCPTCGTQAKRETDTMDTFMESSWYYARYCCSDQKNAMLDSRANYWTPVDQYIGGIEHAVMHLLYARFLHKVLRDEGLLNTSEPFQNLLTQGMVLKDGAKMSKSKGNTVSPQPLIKKYGADTIRFFIIFAAPPQQSLEWSDSGVDGAYRFLKRLWAFCHQHQDALSGISTPCQLDNHAEDEIVALQGIHGIIHQITRDYDRLQLNTVASGCMKIFNILNDLDISHKTALPIMREGISILLRLLNPITPHITHHLWHLIEGDEHIRDAGWPQPNAKLLQQQKVTWVAQVNGKTRLTLSFPKDMPQEEIEAAVKNDPRLETYLTNKTIRKVITVPLKLVNLVVS